VTEPSPVLRQYREAKDRFPDAVLLFRLGDFFEIFFEDAERAAPIMGVALTSRPMGKTGRHPMCGVPYHSWQGYAGKLLRAGLKVVVCDQVEAPTGRGVVRREVTRVLTPGTVIEEEYLDPGRSNLLVAAWSRGREAGLAACDLTAGELLLCQLPVHRLEAELARLQPAELLQPPGVEEYRFDPESGRRRLHDLLGIAYPASIGAEGSPLAVGAAGALLDYLKANQVPIAPGLVRVRTYSPDETMGLDPTTIRNLELPELLRVVDATATAAGARRLRAWLWAPLRDVEAIELRLGAVSELAGGRHRRERLASALRAVGDLERLVTRAAHGIAGPRDLVALRRSLEAVPELRSQLAGAEALALRQLATHLYDTSPTAGVLAQALVEDAPPNLRAGGAVRPGFDAELDRIREASGEAREWIAALEAAERDRTGLKNLKVGFNRVFGYYLEVPRAATGPVPKDYIRKQTVATGERYLTPELKEKEAIVLNAQQDLARREADVLRALCATVAAAAGGLLEGAQAAGELDALNGLASTAADRGWVRPAVDAGTRLEILAGRHPVVEASLPAAEFVPNDVLLDPGDEQVVVLTGPNMAGKSTYLRQVALLVLLAQAGSFLPADKATIGLADRIFTRVGAHDDLAGGMSTFMVEMAETANILNHATPASLVIFDEVGRGTSTYDGLSIAQAVVEHIVESPRLGCRTLFATHFHELTALAERLPRIRNRRVEVAEEAGHVRFLHRVVPGGADRSYGIHVAALAGLPSPVIARAQQVLGELERNRPLEPPEHQLGLPLEAASDPIRGELRDLELDALSPLEALQKLYDLRARLS
jgi:DNA mismatch repair protein MutS